MFGLKKKDKSAPGSRPALSGKARLVIALSALTVAGVCVALHTLQQRLVTSRKYANRFARVALVRPPAWVPPEAADEVLAQTQQVARRRNILDAALAHDVYNAAAANPWIAKVTRVTKYENGRVLVQAKFRRPFAFVAAAGGDELTVVDPDGFVMPIAANRLRPEALPTVRDVASKPPRPGRKWDGADLADGLRLLKLLQDRPYFNEIAVVDVRNFGGRISQLEPHLRMHARDNQGQQTDIRFGRFPAQDGLDYCVSPQRKLEYLDAYYQANGRIAGLNQYIDLRYDRLHVSVN